MTEYTGKRNARGHWIVPPVAYTFKCVTCGKRETRIRHQSGAKARFCWACKDKRKAVYDRYYWRAVQKWKPAAPMLWRHDIPPRGWKSQ